MSDFKCFYCGDPFTQENPYTVDHIIPLSRGGTYELKNLVAAHAKCNVNKGSKYLGEVFDKRSRFEDAVKIYLGLSDFEFRVLRFVRWFTRFFL